MVVKMAASSSASNTSAPSNSDSVMDTSLYDPCSSSNGHDSESDGDMSKGREEKEVASLLDRLRSPTAADIARSSIMGVKRGKIYKQCRIVNFEAH